jgi:C1A family cysteine protease
MSIEGDETYSNEAVGFSAFGGHLLAPEATGDEAGGDQLVMDLASYGIEDAEQLVALAAVPEALEALRSALPDGDRSLEQILDSATTSLPAERVALLNVPAPKDLGLGVLAPTNEMLAAAEVTATEAAEVEAAVTLPPAVNLITYMSPIRNQASRGTCVAFACTSLNEYIVRRRGTAQNLSEQHVYYETKLIDGSANECGTWQSKAVLVLQQRGQCLESVWPYNPNPPCNNHGSRPAGARPGGLPYRLSTLAVSTRNVAAYKAHMARQRPVTLSIPVYNSWYQSAETRRSGRITMRIGNENAVGGHAVCLVGYQDRATSPGGGYFIVRNSWSTSWASQSPYGAGYGTIPYKYITDDAWEAYTAAVPGVGDEDPGRGGGETASGSSNVTIDVSPNIRITISTTE